MFSIDMDDFIAVFDSGVGGISVLRELVRELPNENFLYYGDSANAPYGTKDTQTVRQLTVDAVHSFVKRGAKGVVIACNTATSAAVKVLRGIYPDLPLAGIEPAIKPAVIDNPGKRILVMATPMTIREEKLKLLLSKYEDEAEIIPLACPGLMEYVESGRADSPETQAFLKELLTPYTKLGLAAIVLGCTHYPFVADRIRAVCGDDVKIYDGGAGTARQMRRLLEEAGKLAPSDTKGWITIENSDSKGEKAALSKRLLGIGIS